jgi:hypothetical protein
LGTMHVALATSAPPSACCTAKNCRCGPPSTPRPPAQDPDRDDANGLSSVDAPSVLRIDSLIMAVQVRAARASARAGLPLWLAPLRQAAGPAAKPACGAPRQSCLARPSSFVGGRCNRTVRTPSVCKPSPASAIGLHATSNATPPRRCNRPLTHCPTSPVPRATRRMQPPAAQHP